MTTDKKNARREAAQKRPPLGIVGIREKTSGLVRLFATDNIPAAINRLRFLLPLGQHRDAGLQAAWNDLGADGFVIEVLEELAPPADPAAWDPSAELAALETLCLERLGADGVLLFTHRPF